MQVTVEDLSTVEKKLAVEVPWETVKSKMDDAYRELGREVALKGFRKGKAPRGLLEQLFGKRLERELARQLVEDTFQQAVVDRGLYLVGEPRVEDDGVKSGEAFRYRARVEVAPEVVPRDFDGIPLVRRVRKATDEMIDRELERRRNELTEFRKIEDRPELRVGDVVLCDVMGKVGDEPFAADGQLFEISETSGLPAPWPQVSKVLAGKPLAEREHEVRFTLGNDEPNEALRGKTASLLVTVKDAREKLAPALDDEFAKDTGEADTLAELRDLVRARIERALKREEHDELIALLRRELVNRNPFEVSPTLVERHLAEMVRRATHHLASQGMDLKQEGIDEEKLREQLRPTAADAVRATLIVEAIARKEGVEVLDAEIDKRIAALAAARGTNSARMRAELEKEKQMTSVRLALREEKTLDLLLSKARITDEIGDKPPEGTP
jgi:trigger factor